MSSSSDKPFTAHFVPLPGIKMAEQAAKEADAAKKPEIDLRGITQAGLIVPYPTGIVYSNHAAGYWHRPGLLEGFYVPLVGRSDSDNLNKELEDYFRGPKWAGWCEEIDIETADYLDAIFEKNEITKRLNLKVELEKMKESKEAWVWVSFSSLNEYIANLKATSGVLTWENSD
jgi:hypothetical protein